MDETSNLGRLLAELAPRLGEEHYVFCHVPGGHLGEWVDAAPIASFAEPEGLTLVMRREHADRKGLAYDDEFRCIHLDVTSSLSAVGLTAAVSGALAEAGLCANMFAGYFHDHIFVPAPSAETALACLQALRDKYRKLA